VRELLTPALAGLNPRAYTAHFRRLEPEQQRQYLGALGVDDLKTHFRTLGEGATVGLFLTVEAESFRLDATVGGATLGEAEGQQCAELQTRALSIGSAIEAKVVSGMLVSSLTLLPQTELAFKALRWEPKTLILAGDSGGADCAPSLGWTMRGSIGAVTEAGTFYMPTQALLWDERAIVEERLRELSARTGAVLDVRLA
jgi:hypothetical protein